MEGNKKKIKAYVSFVDLYFARLKLSMLERRIESNRHELKKLNDLFLHLSFTPFLSFYFTQCIFCELDKKEKNRKPMYIDSLFERSQYALVTTIPSDALLT